MSWFQLKLSFCVRIKSSPEENLFVKRQNFGACDKDRMRETSFGSLRDKAKTIMFSLLLAWFTALATFHLLRTQNLWCIDIQTLLYLWLFSRFTHARASFIHSVGAPILVLVLWASCVRVSRSRFRHSPLCCASVCRSFIGQSKHRHHRQ